MKKIIFSLAISTLMACCFLTQANAELSSADKEFLLKQCQVSQEDIDIIPNLKKEVQDKISTWIVSKDCEKLAPFKISRDYYRQLLRLEPAAPVPFPPPQGWHTDYLTDKEYENYGDILSDPKHMGDAFDKVFGK